LVVFHCFSAIFLFSAPGIAETTVLGGRFAGVARTTQALPVVTIPEQGHVTFVRDDVVNIRRRDHLASLLAASAQRMLGQPTSPGLLPLIVVVALGAALSGLRPGRALE
jgi:hypothetical protein